MDLIAAETAALSCGLSPVNPKEGNMVLFDMPNVTSIRVAKFEVRQGSAVYFMVEVVLVSDSCWQWVVEKTFEQFVALHKTLVEKHGIQQDLFPSVGKRQLAQLKLKMIEQLQSQLDRYLGSVLDILGLPPRELLDFLEYKYNDVISITRSLASFAYEHGDMILQEDKAVQITPLQLYCIKRRMVLPVASSETGRLQDDFGNLIDFVQKLHRMKVTPPSEHMSDVSVSNITFDLSLFRGLTVLGLEHIQPSQVTGLETVARQLVTLEAHHCIQALMDILLVQPAGSPDTPPPPLGSLQWTLLTCANFAFNELEEIDSSIKLLTSLIRLDLSYNAITKIENLSELTHLEVVDLSYNCIKSLQGADSQLGHVKELRLSHNQISCLDGIEILSLQCVDLSFNQVTKEDELRHLTVLNSLEELHLHDNPISSSPAYLSSVMCSISAGVSKLILDGKVTTGGGYGRVSEHVHGKLKRHRSVCSDIEEKERLYPVPSKVESGKKLESFDVLKHFEKMREEGGDRWLSMISTSPEEGLLPLQKHKKRHAKKKHREPSNKVSDDMVPCQPTEGSDSMQFSLPNDVTAGVNVPESSMKTKCALESLTPKQPLEPADDSAPKQPLDGSAPKQTLDGSTPKQPLDGSTPKQPLNGSALKQALDGSTPKQPLDGSTPKQPLNGSAPKQPLDVSTPKQPLDSSTPKQPLDGSAPKQPMDGSTPKQPLDSSTPKQPLDGSAPKQSLDGSTPEQPLDVSTPKQPLDSSTPKQPLDVSSPLKDLTLEQALKRPNPEEDVDNSTSSHPSESSTSRQHFGSPTPIPGPSPAKQPLTNTQPPVKQPLTNIQPPAKQPLTNIQPPAKQPLTNTQPPAKQPLTNTQPPAKQPLTNTQPPAKQPLTNTQPPAKQPLTNTQPSAKQPLTNTQPSASSTSNRSHPSDKVHGRTDLISTQPPPQSVPSAPCTGPQSSPAILPCPVVIKPGLESQELMEYFRCSIAREKNETLVAVEWGVCQLPSCFLCGIETGLFVSDRSLYLMEVIAQPGGQLPWRSKSLPLRVIVEASLDELCQVTSGIHDQYLAFELSHRISIQHFAVFLPTPQHTLNVLANLSAVLEAMCVDYDSISSSQRAMCLTMENRVLFVSDDDSDMRRLKCDLVRDRVAVESVNCTPLGEFVTIDSELDVRQACSKVVITDYVVGWEVLSDIIPSSPGVCSLQLRALVLTQECVYLCREDVLSPLVVGSIPMCPASLVGFVLDSCPISEVTCVNECDTAYLPLSPSHPVYQFSIAFSRAGPSGGGSSGEWVFCVHSCQLMGQLISSLSKAWCAVHGAPLPHVHTSIPLVDHLPRTPRPLLGDTTQGFKLSRPLEEGTIQGLKLSRPLEEGPPEGLRFYHNRALLELCMSSYDKKVEFFKEHVALAQFDKTNEGCLAFFMALCSPNNSVRTEIEVFVVASNYAVYLVTTHDNVGTWCGAKGPSSVDPTALQGKGEVPCCFHRVWLSDIKEVTVGLFYLSVQLKTGRANEEGVAIMTQLPSSTLALLGAISGAVHLKDAAEEQVRSDILAEFEDLGEHPIIKRMGGSKLAAKSPAGFRQPHLADGDKLRYLLAENIGSTWSSTGDVLFGLHILGQQVMLFAEVSPDHTSVPPDHTSVPPDHTSVPPDHTSVPPDHTSVPPIPQVHLVLLTNHGLYMCSNVSHGNHSPAVFRAQQLRVKKWCPIEQVGHVEVAMGEHSVKIYPKATSTHCDQPQHTSTHRYQPEQSHTSPILLLVAQNSELVHSFTYLLSLLWSEKNGGKTLTTRVS